MTMQPVTLPRRRTSALLVVAASLLGLGAIAIGALILISGGPIGAVIALVLAFRAICETTLTCKDSPPLKPIFHVKVEDFPRIRYIGFGDHRLRRAQVLTARCMLPQ